MISFSLLSVNNYSDMLSKISRYTFVTSIICVSILRENVVPVSEAVEYINSIFPSELTSKLPFPVSWFGVFVISFVISLLAHAIKLHDRISNILKIRSEFDLHFVLYPLAIASGASLNAGQLSRMRENSNQLMAEGFYKYASSTKPEIDSHTITQALTNWSWYWVCLEALFLFIITAVFLVYYECWKYSAFILFFCCFLCLLMRFFRVQSAGYAESQVTQILQDANRKQQVATLFHAL